MKKNQVTDIRELELQEQKLKSIGQAEQEKKNPVNLKTYYEITQSEQERESRLEINYPTLRDLRNNHKISNICVSRVREKECGLKKMFIKIQLHYISFRRTS